MIHLDMRASAKLVRLIALLERCCGTWDRLSSTSLESLEENNNGIRELPELITGVKTVIALDGSTPQLDQSVILGDLNAYAIIGEQTGPLSLELTNEFYQLLEKNNANLNASINEPISVSANFRTTLSHFISTQSLTGSEEIVFQTSSPFLIEKRLRELIDWLNQELNSGTYHPLIVIGIFHLLFLQISPYKSANHRLSFLLLWYLLRTNSYFFVLRNHFAAYIPGRERIYYAALRQAEKTALTTWSQINVWLECFTELLTLSVQSLLKAHAEKEERTRLTNVQKLIIGVVKNHGTVTRERIAEDTGINISTVKYNLSVLTERGQITREGGGRSTRYRVI